MALPQRMIRVDEASARYGRELVERMGLWLESADPLADALIAATAGWPRARLMRVVERALVGGLDELEEVPEALAALVEQVTTVPAWVDRDQLDRGAAFFLRTSLVGGMVLGAKSLIAGYTAPAGNKPLVMSGRLERGVNRRLAETSRFVYEVSTPGGLRRGEPGVVAAVKVRLIHAQVRRMIWDSGRWDPGWGEPINQHDMMATVLLFSLLLLEGLETLGLRPSAQEAADYTALWRYVGYLMGVETELLPATRAEAERYSAFIDLTQAPPDDDARALTRAFLDAGLAAASSDEERERARRALPVGYALARALLGDELADQLAIPRTSLMLILPLVRRVVRRLEALRRLPGGDQLALAAGHRYWRWALENSQGGIPIEFSLPERLLKFPSAA